MIVGGKKVRKGDAVAESSEGSVFVIPKRVVEGGDESLDLWLEQEIAEGRIPDIYQGKKRYFLRLIDSASENSYEGTIFSIIGG